VREKQRKMTNGRTVTYLIPENDADVEKLRRMAEADELDDRESFGDGSDMSPPPKKSPSSSR
jgi:hypothetical protein